MKRQELIGVHCFETNVSLFCIFVVLKHKGPALKFLQNIVQIAVHGVHYYYTYSYDTCTSYNKTNIQKSPNYHES